MACLSELIELGSEEFGGLVNPFEVLITAHVTTFLSSFCGDGREQRGKHAMMRLIPAAFSPDKDPDTKSLFYFKPSLKKWDGMERSRSIKVWFLYKHAANFLERFHQLA